MRAGVTIAIGVGWLCSGGPAGATESPEASFGRICGTCHGAQPVPRAMSQDAMAELTPEHIFRTISEGRMAIYAISLGSERQRSLAEWVSKVEWGSAPTPETETLVRCERPEPLDPRAASGPRWSGWSPDLDNTRFQPADLAGLEAADLAGLELRWAFGFPGATTAGVQPAVFGGRLFVGGSAGGVYALDAETGCAHWKFETEGPVRATPVVAPGAEGGAPVVYAVDRAGWAYALDAETGAPRWKGPQDAHPRAAITASPVLHAGTLYLVLASTEKAFSASPDYDCCTFRGSVVALDAASGERRWKTYLVGEPGVVRTGDDGKRVYGPSGVGSWSAATLDPEAGALYVTTGNGYTPPAPETSDAVVALDMETGAIRWTYQAEPDDAWTLACITPGANPAVVAECGPDLDFGSSVILRELGGGRRVLLAGQKSGVMHAIDPDREGAVVWTKRLSPGGVLGGIEWGFAAEPDRVFVPISDVWENQNTPGHAGGVYSLRIRDGATLWQTPAPAPDCLDTPGCSAGQPQAATLLPGVLFSGSMDGHMRAYDPESGAVIWDVDTKRSYETVNGIPAHGGSIKGGGVTVVDGWVYFASGYGLWGMPGNVLLAFGPSEAAPRPERMRVY